MMKKIVVVLCIVLWGSGAFAEGETGCTEAETRMAQTSTYESYDSLFTLYQPFIGHITAYQPIYFLMGANPEDSRFQISLKYQLFSSECAIAQFRPWISGFHLGYTQTSSWDLKSESAPFEDTSYKPEVFFITKNISARPDFLRGLFLKAGVMHESNGQAGDMSRSTNLLYLEPISILFDESSSLGLQVSPRFVAYFNNSDNSNPELERYRGQFELELKAGKADSLVFDSVLRFADKGASVQLDLTYPINVSFLSNLSLYLHVQYVDVLAETLLNYEERTEGFRMGIALVR